MKRFLTRALLCTTAIVAPVAGALGQSSPTPPPWYSLDGNGVDLATGSFNFSRTDLAIGPGSGGLSYVEQDTSLFGHYDNLRMAANVNYNTGVVDVFIGNTIDTFFLSGGVFTSSLGRASQFAGAGGSYTYTTVDGTKIHFTTYGGVQSGTATVADRITSPTGVVTTYAWESFVYKSIGPCGGQNDPCQLFLALRLQGLATNRGYGLKLDYAYSGTVNETNIDQWNNKVALTAFNATQVSCNISQDTSCSALPGTRTVRYGFEGTSTTTVTDPPNQVNQVSRYTFDASSRLTNIRLPASTADDLVVSYDGNGRVYQIIKPKGTWTYTYVLSGASVTQTTVADPTGVVGRNRIVAFNPTIARATSDTVAGRTTGYQYDSYGRLTRITAPQGNYVQYTYDTHGNVTQTDAVANANGGGTITTKATYNAVCSGVNVCANKPDSTTDARLNKTLYTYDSTYGVLTDVAPPSGGSPAHYTYGNVAATDGGQIWSLLSETHSAGLPEAMKTSYAYPGSGNPLPSSITTGTTDGTTLVATLGYTYTADGDVQAVAGPVSGMRTRYYYDLNRRRVGVVGPTPGGTGPNGALKNRAVQTNFDGNGRVQSEVQGTVTNQDDGGTSFVALATKSYGYDPAGRLASLSLLGGSGATISSTSYTYDAANRPLTATMAMQSQGPDRTTTDVYDGNGLLSTVTTATGATNPLNGTSDASTITYGYTSNGKVGSIRDGNLNTTSYAYDGFDRPQTTTYAGSTTEVLGYDAASNILSRKLRDNQSIVYTYDVLGNVKTRAGPGLSNAYTYDTLGRLTSATGGSYNVGRTYDALGDLLTDTTGGNTITNTFNLAGRRTSVAWPGGGLLNYQYLATGEMSAIVDGINRTIAFTYDDLGRRTHLSYANGRSVDYGYGSDLRLASLAQHMTGGVGNGTQNDVAYGYGYNPAGQIVSRSTSNDSYAYSPVPTTASYTPNMLNQLTSSTTPFTYDPRGNQTAVGGAPGASHGFDTTDKLIDAGVGTSPHDILSYDALDRLASVQVGTGGGVTRLVWDGDQITSEYDASGLSRLYGYGPGTNEVLVQYPWAGNTEGIRYFHADERGSIVALTDINGQVLRIHSYDAYGVEGAAAHLGRFGYAGAVALPESGLVHMRARAYDPVRGRFVSADPIGMAGGINIYGYAGGDPVNATDPTGLDCDGWATRIPCTSTDGGGGGGQNSGSSGAGSDGSGFSGQGQVIGGPHDGGQGYPSPNGECCYNNNGNGTYTYLNSFSFSFGPTSSPGNVAGAGLGNGLQFTAAYGGTTFGYGPTYGKANRYYPYGRINTGRVGDFSQALSDLDDIANANNVFPLGQLPSVLPILAQTVIPSPTLVGNGWIGSTNPLSGYTTFLNASGLAFRTNAQGDIRVEIPSGFSLPGGGSYNGVGPEVVHYHW